MSSRAAVIASTTFTVPDAKGLLAVEGPELKWGPLTKWSLEVVS
ncbi:hypothetical protein [Streptomyces sp. NRRL B-3648]|nr:hypothetical protein [Streptomyces sp. NRRL B-3648]